LTGDQGVITQIFKDIDYDVNCWAQGKRLIEYYDKKIKSGLMLIVDAGANIGASAVYFLKTFKNSFVYSVEPNINNWKLLELNANNYDNKKTFSER